MREVMESGVSKSASKFSSSKPPTVNASSLTRQVTHEKFKKGDFVVKIKDLPLGKSSPIWKVDTGYLLQKYEAIPENETSKLQYRSCYTFSSCLDMAGFALVDTKLTNKNRNMFTVEVVKIHYEVDVPTSTTSEGGKPHKSTTSNKHGKSGSTSTSSRPQSSSDHKISNTKGHSQVKPSSSELHSKVASSISHTKSTVNKAPADTQKKVVSDKSVTKSSSSIIKEKSDSGESTSRTADRKTDKIPSSKGGADSKTDKIPSSKGGADSKTDKIPSSNTKAKFVSGISKTKPTYGSSATKPVPSNSQMKTINSSQKTVAGNTSHVKPSTSEKTTSNSSNSHAKTVPGSQKKSEFDNGQAKSSSDGLQSKSTAVHGSNQTKSDHSSSQKKHFSTHAHKRSATSEMVHHKPKIQKIEKSGSHARNTPSAAVTSEELHNKEKEITTVTKQKDRRTSTELQIEDSEGSPQDTFDIYVQILLSHALEPEFLTSLKNSGGDGDFYLKPLEAVDQMLLEKKNTIALKIGSRFMSSLTRRPKLKTANPKVTQGDQTDYSSVKIIRLYGGPYDEQKLMKLDQEQDAVEEFMIVGEAALEKVKKYHALHHYKYKLYRTCLKKIDMMETQNLSAKDNLDLLERCLLDQNWLNEEYSKFQALF